MHEIEGFQMIYDLFLEQIKREKEELDQEPNEDKRVNKKILLLRKMGKFSDVVIETINDLKGINNIQKAGFDVRCQT